MTHSELKHAYRKMGRGGTYYAPFELCASAWRGFGRPGSNPMLSIDHARVEGGFTVTIEGKTPSVADADLPNYRVFVYRERRGVKYAGVFETEEEAHAWLTPQNLSRFID